jgi:hypothetical protein
MRSLDCARKLAPLGMTGEWGKLAPLGMTVGVRKLAPLGMTGEVHASTPNERVSETGD